jgi:hypothetical protein
MNDYKPNSNRFKEEQKNEEREKKVEKVVTGPVTTRKKSGLQKFASEFISEDAKNIKSYVFGEVLIPAIKKAISDIVRDGIDMILYGGSNPGSKRGPASTVSYRNYYDKDGRSSRDYRSATVGVRYSYDDIELSSRGEAQEVLDRMDELIDNYGVASVADLYDLVGVTGNYTDNKYGWTSIRSAEVLRTRDGKYVIKMPRATNID